MKFFTTDTRRRKTIVRCRDFISSVAPLGRATGVRDVVQIVWLPVARSQKARFASRKRIKAFHRRIQSSGKSFVTAFDLHSSRSSCTTCGIDARSWSSRLTMSFDSESSLTGLNILCSYLVNFWIAWENNWIHALYFYLLAIEVNDQYLLKLLQQRLPN